MGRTSACVCDLANRGPDFNDFDLHLLDAPKICAVALCPSEPFQRMRMAQMANTFNISSEGKGMCWRVMY